MTTHRAAAMMLVAMTAAATSAALIKSVALDVPVFQLLFLRFFLVALVLIPFTNWTEVRAQKPFVLHHAVRTVLVILGLFSYFWALRTTPLSSAVSVFYAYPAITLVLAWAILGARIQGRTIAAVLVSFAGVLMVLQPDLRNGNLEILLVLVTAVCVASRAIFDRVLAVRNASPVTVLMISSLMASLLLVVPGVVDFARLSVSMAAILVAIAALGALTQLLVIAVLGQGHWGAFAVFGYWEVLISVPLAFGFFGEVPGLLAAIGMALIVVGGLLREKPAPASVLREVPARRPAYAS